MPGCAPRRASQGILCESCHLILVDILRNVPGQLALLRASVEPTWTPTPSPQPTHGKVGPRLSTSTPHYIAAARTSMTFVETEAIRLACLDVAREIEDALSAVVEALCEDYQAQGPARLQTAADREDPRTKRWHPVRPDGEPTYRWEPVVTRGAGPDAMAGQYVWTDPPTRFEPVDSCRWLREQLPRLEHQPGIGDDLEQLSDLMARAHSLAPWREPSQPMHGIPCPNVTGCRCTSSRTARWLSARRQCAGRHIRGSGSDLDAGAGRGPGGRREAGVIVDEREGRVNVLGQSGSDRVGC